MRIESQFETRKMQIKDLGIMRPYLIFDAETEQQQVIFVLTDFTAVVVRNASNCDELIVLKLGKETSVLVIGEIIDMSIKNVKVRGIN